MALIDVSDPVTEDSTSVAGNAPLLDRCWVRLRGDFRRRRLLRGCGLVRGFTNSIALLTTSFTKTGIEAIHEKNQRR